MFENLEFTRWDTRGERLWDGGFHRREKVGIYLVSSLVLFPNTMVHSERFNCSRFPRFTLSSPSGIQILVQGPERMWHRSRGVRGAVRGMRGWSSRGGHPQTSRAERQQPRQPWTACPLPGTGPRHKAQEVWGLVWPTRCPSSISP